MYVVPRLIYSLEVLDMKGNEIKGLEQYQRKSLKQIVISGQNPEFCRACLARNTSPGMCNTQEHA